MKKLKKWLIIFFVSALALSLIGFSLAYSLNFSKGSRAGVVMKLSKKGLAFKTYEGQLDKGGIHTANNGKMSSSWNFSVDPSNQLIIQKLEKASITGERVKLDYEEKYFKFFWRGDTKYFITNVENIEEYQQKHHNPNLNTESENQVQKPQTIESQTTGSQITEQH